jgi:hypothetical protein
MRLVDGATQLPFQLLPTLAADYAALSDAATGTLKPTEGHWGPFRLTVKPTRLQLGNSSGQVIAALSVTGSVKGTVYFWGTPTVSGDGKTVSIPNLTLAATSQTALSSKDARLPDFFANLFKKPIQDAFTVNLAQSLPQTRGTQPISFPLADSAILQLGDLDVSVISLKSVDGELQVSILVKGNANARTP